jgi:hypothetical protein
MHGRRVYLALFTALIAALLLIACGQHSSRVLQGYIAQQHASPQQQPQGDSSNKPIPGVLELDGRIVVNRTVSAEQTITSQGWDAYMAGQYGSVGTPGQDKVPVEQNATNLTLRAYAPGEYAYAVYGQAVGAAPKPLKTLIDSTTCSFGGGRDDEIPLSYYLGVADYTMGAWRWFGPFGNINVLVTVNSETLKSRFKSPSDNFYLCVLASNGGKAASALPKDGLVADFPIDLSARGVSAGGDDPGGLTIEQVVTTVEEGLPTEPAIVTGLQVTADTSGVNLSWDTNIDPDVDIYQVLRADPDTADGPQLLQGVLAPTVIYTDSAGTPGKNYRYFVRARNEAGYGVSSS